MADEKEKAIEKAQETVTFPGTDNDEISGEALDKVAGGGGNLESGLISVIGLSVQDALDTIGGSSGSSAAGSTTTGGNTSGQRTLNN